MQPSPEAREQTDNNQDAAMFVFPSGITELLGLQNHWVWPIRSHHALSSSWWILDGSLWLRSLCIRQDTWQVTIHFIQTPDSVHKQHSPSSLCKIYLHHVLFQTGNSEASLLFLHRDKSYSEVYTLCNYSHACVTEKLLEDSRLSTL